MVEDLREIRNDDGETMPPKVYQILRQAIITEQIPAGERLVERKLAQQLGVSRTPVREAIRRLESEGLVRHISRKGVVVARMSPREVWDVYNIRSVLEGLAARLAAQWISAEELAELEDYLVQMEQAANDKDLERLNSLHPRFNEIIYRASRNPRLHRMINNLADYVTGFTRIGYTAPGRLREVSEEHRAIFEAIKRGDADEAEQQLRHHIKRSCEVYFLQRAIMEHQTPVARLRHRNEERPEVS